MSEDATGVPTVLVAAPDSGTRSLVRMTLGEESYEVLEAEDTDGAIRAIASGRPNLILLDEELPGAGSLKLSRTLKDQPETQQVRVVLMFDKSRPVDQQTGRDAGVDEFLAKPFTAFSLLKKVDGMI